MNRTPVKSSFIESIGHEGDTLEVALKDGGLYKYTGVSRETYDSLIEAESIGKVFREQVLKGGFEVEKVEEEENREGLESE